MRIFKCYPLPPVTHCHWSHCEYEREERTCSRRGGRSVSQEERETLMGRSGREEKFGNFMVVVQLIHRPMWAKMRLTITRNCHICPFFHPLLGHHQTDGIMGSTSPARTETEFTLLTHRQRLAAHALLESVQPSFVCEWRWKIQM